MQDVPCVEEFKSREGGNINKGRLWCVLSLCGEGKVDGVLAE